MTASKTLFTVDRAGDTLIATPQTDLREIEYEQIQAGAEEVLRHLESGPFQNVVMDFRNTDYYGSTALGFFVKIWKRIRVKGGRMAMCNLSEHERDILYVTNLANLWLISPTLEEAIEAVNAPQPDKGDKGTPGGTAGS